MAKRMNLTIRLKNITEQTIAVANTVISPKGQVPVKAKKASHVESVLLAVEQGKVEVLSHGLEALAAAIGATLPEPIEEVELGEFADIDHVNPVDPDGVVVDPEASDEKSEVDPDGSKPDESKPADKELESKVEPQGEPEVDEKPEEKPQEKPEPAKKPAAKKAPAKKPDAK